MSFVHCTGRTTVRVCERECSIIDVQPQHPAKGACKGKQCREKEGGWLHSCAIEQSDAPNLISMPLAEAEADADSRWEYTAKGKPK